MSGGANKTIHRPKNQCRVVITFEVEVAESMMHKMPAWKRHAMSYFRDLRDILPGKTSQGLINTMRKNKTITILSETVEVAP
jgi:hypothetical protein